MGFFYSLGHFCQNLAHPLVLPNYTHTPPSNLQKIYKIELGRMPFPGHGACVVCVILTVVQKSHANMLGFIGQDFYI